MITKNFGQLTMMSVGFCFLFTAFNTCQSFAATVLKDNGFDSLGLVTLSTLYFMFAIFSFFSGAIVNKAGNAKITMGIGGFCYTFWILCFILPAYYGKYVTDHDGKLPP